MRPSAAWTSACARTGRRFFFIELNPLPALHPEASLATGARARGLAYRDIFRLVVRSAARRYGIPLRRPRILAGDAARAPASGQRPTVRELGVRVGRFEPGLLNAITDVKGVKVGHVTSVKDDVKVPGITLSTAVRTGVTAVLPAPREICSRRLVAGGFVLNGVGEMAGLTQVLEWGWLETPILLTNSLSVGRVHSGVVAHMVERNPGIGLEQGVILPIVIAFSTANRTPRTSVEPRKAFDQGCSLPVDLHVRRCHCSAPGREERPRCRERRREIG